MKPIYNRVDSGTCGSGGLFQLGTGGKSAEDLALAAKGKYSGSGGGMASGLAGL